MNAEIDARTVSGEPLAKEEELNRYLLCYGYQDKADGIDEDKESLLSLANRAELWGEDAAQKLIAKYAASLDRLRGPQADAARAGLPGRCSTPGSHSNRHSESELPV